jgi:DNA mismatch endonuclease (patch repair protein)
MMAGIKGKNTQPELFLRKALHSMGFRYRLSGQGLPGKPDIVFPKRRAVIFVNGCFWHRHECAYFKWPATNQQFWREKLNGNAQRDSRVAAELQSKGWTVLTVWECELKESQYQTPNSVVLAIASKLKTLA